jgi:hypothetical protein
MLLMTVGFTDRPTPLASEQQMLSEAQGTADYWKAASYGTINLEFDVAPHYVAPMATPTTCDRTSWNNGALAAARAAGHTGSHPVYYYRGVPCVGTANGNVGRPGIWMAAIGWTLLAHEFGHNLGLYHANSFSGTMPIDPPRWRSQEYGDTYEIMGRGVGFLSATHAGQLGLLPQPTRVARGAGRVTQAVALDPLAGGTGTTAATVQRDPANTYWIERRMKTGLDSVLTGEAAIVRMEGPQGLNFMGSLKAGEKITDPLGGVEIAAQGGGAVTVETWPVVAPTRTTVPTRSPTRTPTFSPEDPTPAPTPAPRCSGTNTALCLAGRFMVTVDWRAPDGRTGKGQTLPFTWESGLFAFFNPDNAELLVKVLDGRGINGKWWVFYGSATNVFFSLTVTDTETGATRTYVNIQGTMASRADTEAF